MADEREIHRTAARATRSTRRGGRRTRPAPPALSTRVREPAAGSVAWARSAGGEHGTPQRRRAMREQRAGELPGVVPPDLAGRRAGRLHAPPRRAPPPRRGPPRPGGPAGGEGLHERRAGAAPRCTSATSTTSPSWRCTADTWSAASRPVGLAGLGEQVHAQHAGGGGGAERLGEPVREHAREHARVEAPRPEHHEVRRPGPRPSPRAAPPRRGRAAARRRARAPRRWPLSPRTSRPSSSSATSSAGPSSAGTTRPRAPSSPAAASTASAEVAEPLRERGEHHVADRVTGEPALPLEAVLEERGERARARRRAPPGTGRTSPGAGTP